VWARAGGGCGPPNPCPRLPTCPTWNGPRTPDVLSVALTQSTTLLYGATYLGSDRARTVWTWIWLL